MDQKLMWCDSERDSEPCQQCCCDYREDVRYCTDPRSWKKSKRLVGMYLCRPCYDERSDD